jgi:hypothetical protein
MKPFENSLASFSEQTYPLSYKMVQAIWNHGRFFLLLWFLSFTRINQLYQSLFLLYTGFRNGFLILFFILGKGLYGIVLYLASLFPHSLLLIPLYLFSFAWIKERGHHREHKPVVVIVLVITFFAACFLEAKYNLALMQNLI